MESNKNITINEEIKEPKCHLCGVKMTRKSSIRRHLLREHKFNKTDAYFVSEEFVSMPRVSIIAYNQIKCPGCNTLLKAHYVEKHLRHHCPKRTNFTKSLKPYTRVCVGNNIICDTEKGDDDSTNSSQIISDGTSSDEENGNNKTVMFPTSVLSSSDGTQESNYMQLRKKRVEKRSCLFNQPFQPKLTSLSSQIQNTKRSNRFFKRRSPVNNQRTINSKRKLQATQNTSIGQGVCSNSDCYLFNYRMALFKMVCVSCGSTNKFENEYKYTGPINEKEITSTWNTARCQETEIVRDHNVACSERVQTETDKFTATADHTSTQTKTLHLNSIDKRINIEEYEKIIEQEFAIYMKVNIKLADKTIKQYVSKFRAYNDILKQSYVKRGKTFSVGMLYFYAIIGPEDFVTLPSLDPIMHIEDMTVGVKMIFIEMHQKLISMLTRKLREEASKTPGAQYEAERKENLKTLEADNQSFLRGLKKKQAEDLERKKRHERSVGSETEESIIIKGITIYRQSRMRQTFLEDVMARVKKIDGLTDLEKRNLYYDIRDISFIEISSRQGNRIGLIQLFTLSDFLIAEYDENAKLMVIEIVRHKTSDAHGSGRLYINKEWHELLTILGSKLRPVLVGKSPVDECNENLAYLQNLEEEQILPFFVTQNLKPLTRFPEKGLAIFLDSIKDEATKGTKGAKDVSTKLATTPLSSTSFRKAISSWADENELGKEAAVLHQHSQNVQRKSYQLRDKKVRQAIRVIQGFDSAVGPEIKLQCSNNINFTSEINEAIQVNKIGLQKSMLTRKLDKGKTSSVLLPTATSKRNKNIDEETRRTIRDVALHVVGDKITKKDVRKLLKQDPRLRILELKARGLMSEKKWKEIPADQRKPSNFEKWIIELNKSYRPWARSNSGRYLKKLAAFVDCNGSQVNKGVRKISDLVIPRDFVDLEPSTSFTRRSMSKGKEIRHNLNATQESKQQLNVNEGSSRSALNIDTSEIEARPTLPTKDSDLNSSPKVILHKMKIKGRSYTSTGKSVVVTSKNDLLAGIHPTRSMCNTLDKLLHHSRTIDRPIQYAEDVHFLTVITQCCVCKESDLIQSNTSKNCENWIGCKCGRWYHKTCINLTEAEELGFSCHLFNWDCKNA